MDTEKKKELWDRLENESERAYRAFESYLTLPSSERTVLAAYRSYVGNPHAAKPSDTWSKWSSQFAWRERAAAYDDHLASLRRDAYERGTKEEAERQGAMAERMRAETFEMLHHSYEKALEWFEREDFDPREMTMSQVTQVIKLHMQAVETFEMTGEPTEGGWTEEDDEEFRETILPQLEAKRADEEDYEDEDEEEEEEEEDD